MSHPSRRDFLKTSAQAATALATTGLLASPSRAADLWPIPEVDVKITRAMKIEVEYDRPRIVAGNSQYRVAGGRRREAILVAFGDNGKIGVGACNGGASQNDVAYVVGKTVSQLLRDHGAVNAKICTSAFWDLAGKTLDQPVYQLLGGKENAQGVPVYDGSIYHEELLPRDRGSAYRNPGATYAERAGWQDAIKEAIDHTLRLGHTFAKVKIGRGALHLSRLAGNYQDAAVLELIRQHAGNEFGIGVDANNGYRMEDVVWLLKEHGDLNLTFIEEMIPDNVNDYRQIQQVIREHKLKTLVADGEGWRNSYDPLAAEIIESGTVDILQGDMRAFHFEGIRRESNMAIEAGHSSRIAPHNWGNEFGFLMQIHVACAIENFYRAEQDPGTLRGELLVRKSTYDIADGRCRNFSAPGLGMELNTKALDSAKVIHEAKL
ncbi:enolase C-terminal domain-like protein [Bremerella sp. JC770]|uniref:enolase C-terminal domain-like protein n=1 Tax=Bremerella sp. JC770 TaxID=3232137 RepID=UPI0034576F25